MTASIALHILAAAAWVGGSIALVLVAVPVLRQLPDEARAKSVRALGRRWKPIGWTSLAVLAGTGCGLAFGYYNAADPDVLFGTRLGHFLVAKAVLFVALVTTASLHDFVLGPRLNRQLREGRPQTLRRPMVVVGCLSLVFTLALPVLGVLMTR